MILFCDSLFLGFIVMAFTAHQVLDAATSIIERYHLSASFFGILVLGVASALPELSTSLLAALEGKGRISAGILLGSNVTNPLFAAGIGAMISTYTVSEALNFWDLPFKILTGLIIFIFYWHQITRDQF